MVKQQCFSSLKIQEKQLLNFHKILWVYIKIFQEVCGVCGSLERPSLISRKVYLELNWIEACILSSDGDSAKLKRIIDAKLHVPIITLSTNDNVNLTKKLNDTFKKCLYCNNYQTILAKLVEKGAT